jgi:Fe-S cluster assembly iron-binding protein IscA
MNYQENRDDTGKLDEVVDQRDFRVIVDSKALMFIIGM